MKTSQNTIPVLFVVICLTMGDGLLIAQEQSGTIETVKSQSTQDSFATTEDKTIPDISGKWEMASDGSPGYCEVFRIKGSSDFLVIYRTKQDRFRVSWQENLRCFQGQRAERPDEKFRGPSTVRMFLEDNGKTLRIQMILDLEGTETFKPIAADLLKNGWTQEQIDGLFNIKMTRSTTPADKPYTIESSEAAAVFNDFKRNLQDRGQTMSTNQFDSADILLIEVKEGLCAFSKSLGKWSRVAIGQPRNGTSRLKQAFVSNYFASVIVDDQLLGFSSQSGRWDQLKIPPQFVGTVQPQHGLNLLSAKIGDQTFALSPRSGKWMSPDSDLLNVDNKIQGEQKPTFGIETPETRQLSETFLQSESQATALAERLRGLLKNKNAGDVESPEVVQIRSELREMLGRGLELKTQIDLLRLKELQSRLSRMEQQIGRRQALRDQIIDRRTRELIEGDETRWFPESPLSPLDVTTRSPKAATIEANDPVAPQPVGTTVTNDNIPAPVRITSAANTPVANSATSTSNLPKKQKSIIGKRPNEFFVINEDGTNLQSLYLSEQHPMIGSPALSPDGLWLAFDDTPTGSADTQIYVLDLEEKQARRICSGMMPTWSTDNRNLVCTRKEPRYGIWLVDIVTNSQRVLRHGNGAQFAPDGTNIAITLNQELSIFNLKTGGNTTILGNRPNPYFHINSNGTWSPDGKSYCFVGQRSNGLREIATITMTGTNDILNLKIHQSFHNQIFTDFAWHPDGYRIVFSSICPIRRGLKQLYEFNPKKTGSIELMAGQDETRNNFDMCWTPDGKRLIYVSGDYCED